MLFMGTLKKVFPTIGILQLQKTIHIFPLTLVELTDDSLWHWKEFIKSVSVHRPELVWMTESS